MYFYFIEGNTAWIDLYLKGNYYLVEGFCRCAMVDPNNTDVYTEFVGSMGKIEHHSNYSIDNVLYINRNEKG